MNWFLALWNAQLLAENVKLRLKLGVKWSLYPDTIFLHKNNDGEVTWNDEPLSTNDEAYRRIR